MVGRRQRVKGSVNIADIYIISIRGNYQTRHQYMRLLKEGTKNSQQVLPILIIEKCRGCNSDLLSYTHTNCEWKACYFTERK